MILRALVAARVQGQHFKVDQAAQRAGQTLFFTTRAEVTRQFIGEPGP